MCQDGKHKFRPRFTEIYTTVITELGKFGNLSGKMPHQSGGSFLKEKRYIHDICVKCGTIVQGENSG
jgi:hypothetical protein